MLATSPTTDRSKNCATCGKARGPLEQRRASWRFDPRPPLVPRPEQPDARPWQCVNDLIVYAGVYRNGGTDEATHLCDDCLRIGLRAIKAEVDAALEVAEAGADKDAEIAALKQRLAETQAEVWRANSKADAAEYWANQYRPALQRLAQFGDHTDAQHREVRRVAAAALEGQSTPHTAG